VSSWWASGRFLSLPCGFWASIGRLTFHLLGEGRVVPPANVTHLLRSVGYVRASVFHLLVEGRVVSLLSLGVLFPAGLVVSVCPRGLAPAVRVVLRGRLSSRGLLVPRNDRIPGVYVPGCGWDLPVDGRWLSFGLGSRGEACCEIRRASRRARGVFPPAEGSMRQSARRSSGRGCPLPADDLL
jgi:hypothetical protein